MDPTGLIGQLLLGILGEVVASDYDSRAAQALGNQVGVIEQYDPTADANPYTVARSDAGAVRSDPSYEAAQRSAIDRLLDVERSGGLTLQDRQAMAQIDSQRALSDQAAYGRINNELQARGTGGGGADLALKLAQAQSSTQANATRSGEAAAQAQQRVYKAIIDRGQMAGQARSQGFEENMRTANARDALARYNNDAVTRAQDERRGARQWKISQLGDARSNAAAGLMNQAQGVRHAFGAGGVAANQAYQGMQPERRQTDREFQDETMRSSGFGGLGY